MGYRYDTWFHNRSTKDRVELIARGFDMNASRWIETIIRRWPLPDGVRIDEKNHTLQEFAQ